MEEECIVIDREDKPLSSASKKVCHLMSNIHDGLLHRAFSVFLFDPDTHRLLLQQRASEKITFPNMWTNTCCSHPLAHPSEQGTAGDLASNVEGVKRAGQRKLEHELGIQPDQVPLCDFNFLTRIHYLAPSESNLSDVRNNNKNQKEEGEEKNDKKEGKWGEHEIDYILFIQARPTLNINTNEVRDFAWVSAEELKQLFTDAANGSGDGRDFKYTPWFRLICESMLFEWWDALVKGGIGDYVGDVQIRRML